MMVRAHNINKIATYWDNFYGKEDGIRMFLKDHPDDSPWVLLSKESRNKITDIVQAYKPIIVAGNKAWISAILDPMKERIDKRYLEQIAKLEKAGDTASAKAVKEEYEKLKITPKRIEDMLRGDWHDANPFNTFLESYMYSADDIVGGFTTWLSGHLTDVENTPLQCGGRRWHLHLP